MAVPRIVIQQGRQQLAMAFISDAAHRQQRCVGMIRRAPLPFPVRLPLPVRLSPGTKGWAQFWEDSDEEDWLLFFSYYI